MNSFKEIENSSSVVPDGWRAYTQLTNYSLRFIDPLDPSVYSITNLIEGIYMGAQ